MGVDWAKLFRRSKPASYEPYAEQQVYPIGAMMRHMARIAPMDYGWYAFSRELLRDKFTDDEKRVLMERAYRCGAEEADLLRAACGCSMDDVLTPAHALFHAVEMQKKATIFTQTEKIALWRGPIPNRSTIRCLGEIAAMQFAAAMEGLTYSPYCLDVLLVYGYDMRAASALFDEIKGVLDERPYRLAALATSPVSTGEANMP